MRAREFFMGLAAMAVLVCPVEAQRRAVLPQIEEPHPYYYRELYLPQLTSGPSSLSWGPDSGELIYSMAGSLWRQKLNSTDAVQLTDGAGYDYQPDWSPDGESVVYVSYQHDAMELWILDLASGQTHPLTSGGAVNVEPRWSPDGKRLVWVSTEFHGRFHIFAADVAGGKLKNVVRLTGEARSELPRYYYSAYDMEINPVWTRDGKEILFVSNRGHIHGTGGFCRMKAEPGAAAHEIHYEETNWKARPDFSPDGSRMVYSSYLGRQWLNLWVMPAGGGDAFPISYGDWDETNVRWSPDGGKLAFLSNREGFNAIGVKDLAGRTDTWLSTETRRYRKPRQTLVLDSKEGLSRSTPARFSVTDEFGKSYAPQRAWIQADDGYDRKDRAMERHYYYVFRGSNEMELPTGRFTIEVSRGFKEKPYRTVLEMKAGQGSTIAVQLQPLEFEAPHSGRWVSSDLHVHMNYGGGYLNSSSRLVQQGAAEGLDIIHELVVNKEQRFPDIDFFASEEKRTAGKSGMDQGAETVLVVRGQEFHTSYWGHRGILGLNDHLLLPGYAGYPNTAAASLFPMNADVYDMAKKQGALVGAVHPFDAVPDPFAEPAQRITDELPVDVALGKLDYLEIVGFSDHKSTAEVWYKLLNLGFRIPAGAGTDATMNYAAPIRGTLGQNRVYAWTPDGPGSLASWMDGLKQGRTIATNGPLVEFTLGGEMVGSELKLDAAQAAVPFSARLRSIVPVDHLEVVCNGTVVRDLKLEGARDSRDVAGTIPVGESGWCVLRAWSEKAEYPVMDAYEYATTSPVYLTVGGKRAYSRVDAEYFAAWIGRTLEITAQYPDWNSREEKESVLQRLRKAREVYLGLR